MKYLLCVAALLFGGLNVGCAPAVSQASHEVTPGGTELDLEPGNTPTAPVQLTPTNLLSPTATAILGTASPTPVTPTDRPTPSPTATSPPPIATPTPPAVSTTVKDGLQLYQEQRCGNCHRLDVAGAYGMLGPTHNGIAATAKARLQAADYFGTATTPAEYIRESIVNPGIYLAAGFNLPRQKMAAFTNLSEAEVEALVQFLLQ